MEAYEYYKSNSYSTYFVNSDQLPEIQYTSDGILEVIYSPEHSMTLGTKTILKKDIEIPGRINEITCLPLNLRTGCNAVTDLLVKTYRLVWKSHPNPEKLGKSVRVKFTNENGGGEIPLDQSFLATYEAQFLRFSPSSPINDSELKSLEPSHLRCDSYAWYDQLLSIYSGNSSDLRLNEWSQEDMRENPETSLSENRTNAAHLGVNLTKTSDGLEVQNIEFPGTGLFMQSLFLFLGDVIGWNLVNGPQTCDLAFNFDTASFIGQFRKIQNQIEEEAFTRAYLENESDLEKIAINNRFNVLNFEYNFGADNEFTKLALLGLVDGNFNYEEVLVDVIMLDGSIESLPLEAYNIRIKEPVE